MRDLHNIEKSAFRKGEYVGYGAGLVWRIFHTGTGWVALSKDCPADLRATTLASLSERLATLPVKTAANANA